MVEALDTTHNCTPHITALKAAGIHTIIRYYSRSSWKRITGEEAAALGDAGFNLVAIYQNRQDRPEDFSEAQGRAAGAHAYEYATEQIFQPGDTAIYFAADFDPTDKVVNDSILPYLRGIQDVFEERAKSGGPHYNVGLYGSGRALRLAKKAGLIQYCWLSQSTGFSEYARFRDSREWHLLQLRDTIIANVPCDPDEINADMPDIGSFRVGRHNLGPAIGPVPVSAAHGQCFMTLARSGVRLRPGPGLEFDPPLKLLPLHTKLTLISRHGDWCAVDLNGDGAVDGFVHNSLIVPC